MLIHDLAQNEIIMFNKMNENNRLINSLISAQKDFNSGNFITPNSAHEYLAMIDKLKNPLTNSDSWIK